MVLLKDHLIINVKLVTSNDSVGFKSPLLHGISAHEFLNRHH